MKDDSIDWEKVLAYLDAKKNDKLAELSPEEAEMLLFAEEIRDKLKFKNPEVLFPLEEGIYEFSRRKKQYRFRQLVKYAAAIIVFLGIGSYIFIYNHQPHFIGEQTVKNSPSKEIKLKLGTGEEVIIDAQSKKLEDQGNEINITDKLISFVHRGDGNHKSNGSSMYNLEVPAGKRTKVLLADGTQVWVNSGTLLRYPAVFKGDKREVYLAGEAYFDVAHNSKNPFIVHVGDLSVHVLGTAFGINTFNGEIKTALVRGSVELDVAKQKQKLLPGQVGQYNRQSAQLFYSDEEVRSIVAWKDNILYFDNLNLDEIVDRLGRTYDYQFVFDNPALRKLSFTIDIEQSADIETVLGYLKMSFPNVDFKIANRTIHIVDKK